MEVLGLVSSVLVMVSIVALVYVNHLSTSISIRSIKIVEALKKENDELRKQLNK